MPKPIRSYFVDLHSQVFLWEDFDYAASDPNSVILERAFDGAYRFIDTSVNELFHIMTLDVDHLTLMINPDVLHLRPQKRQMRFHIACSNGMFKLSI